jgi:hypothetical protein
MGPATRIDAPGVPTVKGALFKPFRLSPLSRTKATPSVLTGVNSRYVCWPPVAVPVPGNPAIQE